MTPLTVPHRVVDEVVTTITRCGAGRKECIVYVTAPTTDRHRADDVLHPDHAATAASTEVTGDELDRIWDELRHVERTLVLQVHSHPQTAHHSGTDDRWPAVHRVGFPSLVLANFGRAGLRGSHLAIYRGDGSWDEPDIERWAEFVIFEGA